VRYDYARLDSTSLELHHNSLHKYDLLQDPSRKDGIVKVFLERDGVCGADPRSCDASRNAADHIVYGDTVSRLPKGMERCT
jgi:hypothetical protein